MSKTRYSTFRRRKISLEASTVCQLKCPSCPTASGETGRNLGVGSLRLRDFKAIVDQNPWVSHIELSNWGEIFLNKNLREILEYAHEKGVALSAANGANLNHLGEGIAEALVKYRFRKITCSIDGASQETYPLYRVGGDFREVIQNIKTINRFKREYRSPYPRLVWQYVVFGHNEHEIADARAMARDLNMEFSPKLSWEGLWQEPFSPIENRELIRQETGLGVADRSEYREKYGEEYALRHCCAYMWRSPQVNFDGRVLGCPVNYWGDYGNALEEGLVEVLNSDRMRHARSMLLGEAEAGNEIPCTSCPSYKQMKESGNWLRREEALPASLSPRWRVVIGNRLAVGRPGAAVRYAARWANRLAIPTLYRRGLKGVARQAAGGLRRRFGESGAYRLPSGIWSLRDSMTRDSGGGWRSRPFFRGKTDRIREFACHMSELSPGSKPHPPHRHKEEEILMVLEGQVSLTLPDLESGQETATVRVWPGELVYYPAFFGHTLEATGEGPARYVMFKWWDKEVWASETLPYGHYDPGTHVRGDSRGSGFQPRKLFGGRTECLEHLRCHTSTLSPGAGYPPHEDPYDVAIIVMRGEVETLGRKVGEGSLIFYAAGEPHGIRNPGDVTAEYVVFEFHGRPSRLQKARDPVRWLRKIRSLTKL